MSQDHLDEPLGPERRKFLEGAAALGLGGLLAALQPGAEAQQTEPASNQSSVNKLARLENIAGLKVFREDIYPIPGGNEYHYEFEAVSGSGKTIRFITSGSKVEDDMSYTAVVDVTVRSEASEAPATRQHIETRGIKGVILGNTRQDQVHMKTTYPDGTVKELDKIVMVNLDHSRNEGRDFATIATIAGRKAIAGRNGAVAQ